MEIVTEPDIRSPEEAKAFAQKLRAVLLSIGVSDCSMEKGSMRVDANVSVRPAGHPELGVKTEVKNMNSFRSLQRALAYEVERQLSLLDGGEEVVQETRHWDETLNVTSTLRTKEYAHDYRYFAEPDLVPMEIDPAWSKEIGATIPELPDARKKRLIDEYGLPVHDATVLTGTKAMGDFFEEAIKTYGYMTPKALSNWMLGELSMHLNSAGLEIDESAVTPKHLVELLRLVDDGTISGKIAKDVFEEMFETGKLPHVIVEEKGWVQISDEEEIGRVVDLVIEENPSVAAEVRAGKEKAIGFLVGQVMRLTKGKANPALVNRLLREKLA